KELWNVFQEMDIFTDKRLTFKKQHLQQVMGWVHTKTCLRQKLYAPFEQPIQDKETNSCSNSGFTFSAPSQPEKVVNIEEKKDWQSLLKQVLLIGDKS